MRERDYCPGCSFVNMNHLKDCPVRTGKCFGDPFTGARCSLERGHTGSCVLTDPSASDYEEPVFVPTEPEKHAHFRKGPASLPFDFDTEDIVSAVEDTDYAKNAIREKLRTMTSDQRMSLYRAVVQLHEARSL